MSQQWFTSRGGREDGPFPPAELKRLADAGQLLPTDLVRRGDRSEWVVASSVKGLFGQPVAAGAHPSPAPKSSAKPPPLPSVVPPPAPMPSPPDESRSKKITQPTATSSSNTTSSSLSESESSSLGDDDVVEDRSDEARKPASIQRKFEQRWKRPSSKAKAGIIGGGCGGLLLFFGLCGGIVSLLSPAPKDAYLPHKPGTSREYIRVVYTGDGDTLATLSKHNYKENGIIEKVITKVGKLEGKEGLLDGGKVKWVKSINIPSDFPEHHRVNGEFIEIGSHLAENDEITWEPCLKVGAKPKDTWAWEPIKSLKHQYTVTEQKAWKGKSGIVVREATAMGDGTVIVAFHTYVRGVGLVETYSRAMDPNSISKKMGYDLKLSDE